MTVGNVAVPTAEKAWVRPGSSSASGPDSPIAVRCMRGNPLVITASRSGCSNGNGTNGTGRANGANHVGAGGTPNAANKGSAKSSGATPGATPGSANACAKCRTDYSSCMKHCFE